ncbi:unnamed protein product [Meganyctiphanes norvegica]|uniref:PDZ domain-containing protein n=1 Tax=Meganyctiphanes norvegica TaxID=48144 RepID=A0AAV2QJR8_MEGNR
MSNASTRRFEWRGSSGTLWGRGSKETTPDDGPDILNGARDIKDGGGVTNKSRKRPGIRKRFRSLTEGLVGFLQGGEKKETEEKPFKRFNHNTDMEVDVINSGYASDYSSEITRYENPRYHNLASFRAASRGVGSWNTPGSPGLTPRGLKPLVKAPPSPPPRRYSLWAFDHMNYEHMDQQEPIYQHTTPKYLLTNAPPAISSMKPPPPPPPVRYIIPTTSAGSGISFLQPVYSSIAGPKSPRLAPRASPVPAISSYSHNPPVRRALSPFRSATPHSDRSCTPIGSPVLRGRSSSDSRPGAAGSNNISHSDSGNNCKANVIGGRVVGFSIPGETRAEWYKRKANIRQREQSPVGGSSCIISRSVGVVLEKEGGSFGFTVRGGHMHDPAKARPLIITHVRPGGPADRDGTIKAGDRLVSVDGRDLTRVSLSEAQETLKKVERGATLTIEYDVSVMESVRCSGGPLLVEIERAAGTSLGITLTHGHHDTNTIVVDTIKTASIAERCGALAVGDTVAAIDGIRLDQLTVAESTQLLKTAPGAHVTLEIVPSPPAASRMTFRKGGSVAFPHLYGGSSGGYSERGGGGGGGGAYLSAGSSYNTLSSRPRSAAARRVQRRNRPGDRLETASLSSHATSGSGGVSGGMVGVSHPECLTVTLVVEGRGYGIVVRPPSHPQADPDTALPVVAAIDSGGPADKSSVICLGDRLVGVNGRSVAGMGVSEVTQMIANSRPTVTLDLEFDVADSVVPSSGTFAVKLPRRHNGLGITLTASRRAGSGEPLLISEIIRGSPAHRSGTLQPGDRLLAIDKTRLEHLTLEDACNILNCCDDIVTLRVQKDDLFSEESDALVVYTVELVRHGGALGITISGSEEPFDPIYIAGLAPGGLADRTGAIHVGDRLLAINGSSLRGKPLSEAIVNLQNSGDTVTLKISRPRDSGVHSEDLGREDWLGHYAPAIPSVDSAVESWDSSALDHPQESMSANSKRDSGSDIVFRSDCGSTVRRRGEAEGKEDANVNGEDGDNRNRKVEDKEISRDTWRSPSPPHSVDSGQSEDKTDWDKMIADLNQISESCGLRGRPLSPVGPMLANEHTGTVIQRKKETVAPIVSIITPEIPVTESRDSARCQTLTQCRRPEIKEEGATSLLQVQDHYTTRTASPSGGSNQVYQVTLMKDPVYEDFGLSVSDGLYEKGVYVNRVRKGGPADRSGVLAPFDRILQVNDTRTEDFDCCLTVPLMAAAGDRMVLVVSRNPHTNPTLDFTSDHNTWPEIDEEEFEAGSDGPEVRDGSKDEGLGRDVACVSPTPSFTPIPTMLKML